MENTYQKTVLTTIITLCQVLLSCGVFVLTISCVISNGIIILIRNILY